MGDKPGATAGPSGCGACNAADEFPVWFPRAIDAEWHSSDTVFDMWTPGWGRAHTAFDVLSWTELSERVEPAIALTDSVYDFYSSYWGISLSPAGASAFAAALAHQQAALTRIQSHDVLGYIAEMQAALADYQAVSPAPVDTLCSWSFEDGPAGWTHGGRQDEWELGVPSCGPVSAHSGRNCWGTGLDRPYANNDDCWLESPPMDLSGLTFANLSFWVWNSVEDFDCELHDPVWVEIPRDGDAFRPLSSRMSGVNDDPEITAIGGWSHVVLDLAEYLGNTAQLRFRFRSDGSTVFVGSYIDDVQVIGRRTRLPSVVRRVLLQPAAVSLEQRASLLDISGRKVMTLQPGANDVRRLPSGVYFVWEGPQTPGYKPRTVRKIVVVK
jgi:hypothetical protein